MPPAVRTEGIDATLEKHQLDAIIAPSRRPGVDDDWVNGDHYTGGDGPRLPWLAIPEVTVPAGTIFGLPVGLSFIGGASRPVLIRLAYAFEQATQARRQPHLLPTVDERSDSAGKRAQRAYSQGPRCVSETGQTFHGDRFEHHRAFRRACACYGTHTSL